MRSTTFFLGALALVFVGAAPAGEVFMCKSYGGGTFWSSAHCSRHNALIERIVSVPDGMPFDQQVKLAVQFPGQGIQLRLGRDARPALRHQPVRGKRRRQPLHAV